MLKLRLSLLAVVVAALSAPGAHADDFTEELRFNPPKQYYLALGDSFTYGFQFSKLGLAPTAFNTGYVDAFATRMRTIRPDLLVVNYGCPGESSVTFIAGGCSGLAAGVALHDDYEAAQLDAAVAFLRAHPGRVSPITLTVWSNDFLDLVRSCGGDFVCVQAQAPAASAQYASRLALILHRLRAVAPSAELIGRRPDGDAEVPDVTRTPAAAAKLLARCQHAKAARRDDPHVEVSGRRGRSEAVDATEPRLGRPSGARRLAFSAPCVCASLSNAARPIRFGRSWQRRYEHSATTLGVTAAIPGRPTNWSLCLIARGWSAIPRGCSAPPPRHSARASPLGQRQAPRDPLRQCSRPRFPGAVRNRIGEPMSFWDPLGFERTRLGLYVQSVQALATLGDSAAVDCALRLFVVRNAYHTATPRDLLAALVEFFADAEQKLTWYAARF